MLLTGWPVGKQKEAKKKDFYLRDSTQNREVSGVLGGGECLFPLNRIDLCFYMQWIHFFFSFFFLR